MNISAKKKLLLGGVLVGTLSSMGLSTVGAAPNSKFCVNTASGNVRVVTGPCDSNELQLKGAKGATGSTGATGATGSQGAAGATGSQGAGGAIAAITCGSGLFVTSIASNGTAVCS